MVAVYRAPMRSRNDAVELEATLDRARRLGICGFGQLVSRSSEQERLVRRIDRFAELPDGSFVWTRDTDGLFWLGRVSGAYFYDADQDAMAVDLVHVRPCEWLTTPILEHDAPAAAVATFGRSGRNFQEIHDPSIGEETQRIWQAR
ncbi:GAF domain-containing protein [Mycobacterium paraterrae]|uniref:GAF domain-containing protein n=1 Tax=Mycobacterium paraterrae TaxID=577492 RepID=A0ABY3VJ72_9MYCO|nr:GAF domain-containing protein [Mycobacterium paraterrae]UMB68210.1 GAF domain-containing protein [Mycobacterium paraterrae]